MQKSNQSLLAVRSIPFGYFLQITACEEPLETHSWKTWLWVESSKWQSQALPCCREGCCWENLKWAYWCLSVPSIKL